jgi:2-hydroxy-3-keto-5-methylthiopentenyl-1-phosphate phosphatase
MSEWIVVTDFDGTITEKDVGNEICKFFRPEEYQTLSTSYRNNELTLRDFQQKMWSKFPAKKDDFVLASLRAASLRPGVNEFLEACAHKDVPVYIASCGMDVYIESVIERFFSKFAQAAIKGISSNKTCFTETELESIIAPNSDLSDPDPLHKGKWAQELARKHRSKVMAIGNGSSDKTFLGHVDLIFATEKLKDTCEKAGQPYTPFENFFDILKAWPLR